MAIQRSGPTPSFYEYICSYLLIPFSGPPTPALMVLAVPGQQLNWVEIPSFQRGISWDIENVKELLQSSSILLGNAILSQFTIQPGQFANLPVGQTVYLTLVDGLQRFAVGTAILSALHQEVLAPTPNRPADSTHFSALTARVVPLSAFYVHNNVELSSHPRQAIRDQYTVLRTSISAYIQQELDAGRGASLAAKIVPLFLSRQLALDIYFNFNRQELLSTFIGINTVRVDLGPMDLLRASILEQATISAWSQSNMEAIENDFTDTFTDGQKPKQDYIPFINAALKAIARNKGNRLFPSWGAALAKSDVDQFLVFVDQFEASENSYLEEIILCGKLPASIVFAYYYLDFLHGSKNFPAFFTKGNAAADSELHAFLVASYRLLIDGTIGRTTDYLERLIEGGLVINLSQLADTISVEYIGTPIASSVDQQWLETNLNGVDQKRASRVFNAMLLPDKTQMGSAFTPIKFGRSAKHFHIDHLVPDSLLIASAPGGAQGQTLRNFAPLPTNQNRVAKATSCSSKLASGGVYETYCNGNTHFVHPYSQWILTTNVAPYSGALDNQANLERNSNPDIGSHRIHQISSVLLQKI